MRLAFTEGKWQVLTLTAAIVFLAWIHPLLGLIPLALLIFILFFYRDPRRDIAGSEHLILAAADGVVTKITRTDCAYVGKDSWEVSVFMSPFNVHVNRSPIKGVVETITHSSGKFLPAMNPEAPLVNEKRIFCIRGKSRVKAVQIAGIMARRTVAWISEGKEITQGEKIGMIKLGSCTQLVFPAHYRVLVKEGDTVRAGLTIIGEE